MASATCAICLDDLKEPMSIPCGHVHCFDCLERYIQSHSEDALESNCPTCRAPFSLVVPVMRHVPERFHKFVTPTIRRLYLDTRENEGDNAELESLRARIQTLEREAARRERYSRNQLATERALRKEAEGQCEQERLARERSEKLLHEEHQARKRATRECMSMRTEYLSLKKKLDIANEDRDKAFQLYDDTYEKYDDLKTQFRIQQDARVGLEARLAEAIVQRDRARRLYAESQHEISLNASITVHNDAQVLSSPTRHNVNPLSRSLQRTVGPSWTQSIATLPAESDTDEDVDEDDERPSLAVKPRVIRPLPRRAMFSGDAIVDAEGNPQGVRRPREEDEAEVPGMYKRTRFVRPLVKLSFRKSDCSESANVTVEHRDIWDGSFLSISQSRSRASDVCGCGDCH